MRVWHSPRRNRIAAATHAAHTRHQGDRAAEAQLQAHHLAEITGSVSRSRPRTAAEVLEECEGEMDSELEELFRRNQTNLTHIKQEIAVMKGEQSTSLIDEAPTPVKAPQERDPDVDTPMVRRPVRSTVPRPGTSEGRRLKCSASSVARRPKTPSVADILRGVRDDDDDSPRWNDAIDQRTTATVSPDRVVATKHAYLLGDGPPSNVVVPLAAGLFELMPGADGVEFRGVTFADADYDSFGFQDDFDVMVSSVGIPKDAAVRVRGARPRGGVDGRGAARVICVSELRRWRMSCTPRDDPTPSPRRSHEHACHATGRHRRDRRRDAM